MKLQSYKSNTFKSSFIALFILVAVNLAITNKAYSQIDYNYGRNLKGIRLSAGIGFAFLQTHFTENPTIANFVGNLDYDFNPYFSIGGEGQVGSLQGIDKVNHLPYSSSTNDFLTANINVKAALGLFYKFDSESTFMDAVKHLYIGAGIGGFKSNIKLTQGTNPNIPTYGTPITNDKSLVFPFSFGTNIDLLGLTQKDILVINPGYQFDIIHSPYADGFITNASSKTRVGYYTLLSLKLKYKF